MELRRPTEFFLPPLMRPYLIFSDLDGTLLDHHDYSFESASAALALISKLEIPLILNSSKTEVEIRAIRKNLNNNDPFVVENGAVFYIPGGVFPGFSKPLTEISFAPDYETIVKIEVGRNLSAFVITYIKS